MIVIKKYNNYCKILGPLKPYLRRDISYLLSYEAMGFKFFANSQKFNNWDGRYRLLTKSNEFPIGLLSKVTEVLERFNEPFKVCDERPSIRYGKKLKIKSKSFIPRDYQVDIVKRSIEAESGIIRSATGSGKTSVIAMLSAHYNVKTIIFVIGIELLFQMKNTIEGLYGVECGIVGGGHCDVGKQITIMTIWSAANAFNKKVKIEDCDVTQDTKAKNKNLDKIAVKKLVNECKLMIIDECQYAASNTVQFLHKETKSAKHRFLFSGTPWRDYGDDILIEAVGGPKIYDLNASKLIDQGYLVKPKIYFSYVPPIKNIGDNYNKVYSNYIVKNDVRNDLIVKYAKQMVSSGKKVLILVVRVEHGNILKEKFDDLSVEFLDGGNSAKDRINNIERMKSGEIDILIASKIFDQGVDIPDLDALILAGSGKSSGRALQRIGRVVRKSPGKTSATVLEFFDDCKYLRNHSLARMKVYSSEPSFEIIKSNKIPKNKTKKFTRRN